MSDSPNRRQVTKSLVRGLALAAAGLITGTSGARDKPTFSTINSGLEPLRSAFNSEPGHVRAILLASPT